MPLPTDYLAFLALAPQEIQALGDELVIRPLNTDTIEAWLMDWGSLSALFQECLARFDTATALNTADETARERLLHYRETILPIERQLGQALNERLKAHESILPSVVQNSLKRQTALEEKLALPVVMDLKNQEYQLISQFESIMGAQTVTWEGQTIPLRRLRAVLQDANREKREQAWRMMQTRRQADSAALAPLWSKLLDVRLQLAAETGFPDYLAYRWAELERSDYRPDDSLTLHSAIAKHFTPLYTDVLQTRQNILKLEATRPWDVIAPLEANKAALFADSNALLQKTIRLFRRLDADFAAYVENLAAMGFIHLVDGSNTSSVGGFSRAIGRHGNFIFLNIQGTSTDLLNLVHELGHAVSIYASCQLPYQWSWGFPADFSETPSSVMEMLTQPYWDEFYHPEELRLVQQEYFRNAIHWSLQDGMLDAFQHWVYRQPESARDIVNCQHKWQELHAVYNAGIDWTGLESFPSMDWQMPSVYMPLHALEYFYGRMVGLKLLELSPQAAIQRYKAVIALGNSLPASQLFERMGLKFPISEADIQAIKKEVIGNG